MSKGEIVPDKPIEEQTSDQMMLTKAQAASLMQVSARTLDRLVARGEIPNVRLGRCVRIPMPAFASSWKCKLNEPTQEEQLSQSSFIPVQIKEEMKLQMSAAPTGTWACEIIGPKVRLRLRERPDEAELRMLVALVAGEAR